MVVEDSPFASIEIKNNLFLEELNLAERSNRNNSKWPSANWIYSLFIVISLSINYLFVILHIVSKSALRLDSILGISGMMDNLRVHSTFSKLI